MGVSAQRLGLMALVCGLSGPRGVRDYVVLGGIDGQQEVGLVGSSRSVTTTGLFYLIGSGERWTY